HEEERAAERVHVRRGDDLPGPLLGRGVLAGADEHPRCRGIALPALLAGLLDRPEVEELGARRRGGDRRPGRRPDDHHVLRLHVPVDEPVLVDDRQPAEQLEGPVYREGPGDRFVLAAQSDQPEQVGPVHELHRDQVLVGRLPTCIADPLVEVEPGDRRVLDLHHHPGFLLEAAAAAVRVADEGLDGDEPGRVELPAAVHLALTALPELVEQQEPVQGQVAAELIEVVGLEPLLDGAPLVVGQPGRGRGLAVPPVRRLPGELIEDRGEFALPGFRGLLPPLGGDDPTLDQQLREVREFWHRGSRCASSGERPGDPGPVLFWHTGPEEEGSARGRGMMRWSGGVKLRGASPRHHRPGLQAALRGGMAAVVSGLRASSARSSPWSVQAVQRVRALRTRCMRQSFTHGRGFARRIRSTESPIHLVWPGVAIASTSKPAPSTSRRSVSGVKWSRCRGGSSGDPDVPDAPDPPLAGFGTLTKSRPPGRTASKTAASSWRGWWTCSSTARRVSTSTEAAGTAGCGSVPWTTVSPKFRRAAAAAWMLKSMPTARQPRA